MTNDNQLFHISNHWALEKNAKNLKAQVYFDDNSGINLFLPAKTYFGRQKVFLPLWFLPWKKLVFSTFWQKPANPESLFIFAQ